MMNPEDQSHRFVITGQDPEGRRRLGGRGDPGGSPVSRAARWALSPLDLQAHLLLPEGCHPKGVLKARCGHLLPMRAIQFAQIFARKCTHCHLVFLSDAILALRRENPDAADGQAGHDAPPVKKDISR